MNTVQLVGEVTDRPFRPGAGARTVIKIRVHDDASNRFDNLEFDAFGAPGDFGLRLYTGDRVAVRGRLEDRQFTEHGETVNEIRIVANHIELVKRASDGQPRQRPEGEAAE
jgi:single-stranded DNA-binding protein